MKKRMALLALAALMLLLAGCGAIIVEDSEVVRIGSNGCVQMFT